jgi:hypothetical protein
MKNYKKEDVVFISAILVFIFIVFFYENLQKKKKDRQEYEYFYEEGARHAYNDAKELANENGFMDGCEAAEQNLVYKSNQKLSISKPYSNKSHAGFKDGYNNTFDMGTYFIYYEGGYEGGYKECK